MNRTLEDVISKISGTHKSDPIYYGNATIKSIDKPNRVCEVLIIDGFAEYRIPNVRLMAVVDDGILIIPSVESTVVILYSRNVEPTIVQYSEIDTITLKGGEYGGLVQSDIVTQKINNIEKKINDLINVFTSWTPISGDGGLALKNALSVWVSDTIEITNSSDLQNKSIVHGK